MSPPASLIPLRHMFSRRGAMPRRYGPRLVIGVPNTIGILQRAADLGVKLAFEPPNTLTYEPIEKCPPAFLDTLKDHKWLLIDLLRLPFCMVYSKRLEETVFFCEDEDTKAALVHIGSDEMVGSMNTTRIATVTVPLSFMLAAVSFAANPYIGTWKFNGAKSKLRPGVTENSTVTYSEQGGQN